MQRNQAVELLRILAAFSIVWYHSNEWGSSTAYAGLSVFLILTTAYETGLNYSRTTSMPQLALRLLLPWAFWFAVYALITLIRGRPVFGAYPSVAAWALGGSSLHLWYLPYIFAAIAALGLIKKRVSQQHIFFCAFACSMAVLALVSVWRPWSLSVGAPVAQYAQAITPLLLGIMIGTYSSIKYGYLALCLVLASILLATLYPHSGVAWPHLIGGLAVLFAMRAGDRLRALSFSSISKHMLGVYLVHPLFIELAPNSLRAFWLATPTVAFAASLIFVVAIDWVRRRAIPQAPAVV